jgi:hypothetical protein
MTPLQIRCMRLNRPSADDARWIWRTVNEISRAFGAKVILSEQGSLCWTKT